MKEELKGDFFMPTYYLYMQCTLSYLNIENNIICFVINLQLC